MANKKLSFYFKALVSLLAILLTATFLPGCSGSGNSKEPPKPESSDISKSSAFLTQEFREDVSLSFGESSIPISQVVNMETGSNSDKENILAMSGDLLVGLDNSSPGLIGHTWRKEELLDTDSTLKALSTAGLRAFVDPLTIREAENWFKEQPEWNKATDLLRGELLSKERITTTLPPDLQHVISQMQNRLAKEVETRANVGTVENPPIASISSVNDKFYTDKLHARVTLKNIDRQGGEFEICNFALIPIVAEIRDQRGNDLTRSGMDYVILDRAEGPIPDIGISGLFDRLGKYADGFIHRDFERIAYSCRDVVFAAKPESTQVELKLFADGRAAVVFATIVAFETAGAKWDLETLEGVVETLLYTEGIVDAGDALLQIPSWENFEDLVFAVADILPEILEEKLEQGNIAIAGIDTLIRSLPILGKVVRYTPVAQSFLGLPGAPWKEVDVLPPEKLPESSVPVDSPDPFGGLERVTLYRCYEHEGDNMEHSFVEKKSACQGKLDGHWVEVLKGSDNTPNTLDLPNGLAVERLAHVYIAAGTDHRYLPVTHPAVTSHHVTANRTNWFVGTNSSFVDIEGGAVEIYESASDKYSTHLYGITENLSTVEDWEVNLAWWAIKAGN